MLWSPAPRIVAVPWLSGAPSTGSEAQHTEKRSLRGRGEWFPLQCVGAKLQKSQQAHSFQAKDDGKRRADTPVPNLRKHEKAQHVSQEEDKDGQAVLQHG